MANIFVLGAGLVGGVIAIEETVTGWILVILVVTGLIVVTGAIVETGSLVVALVLAVVTLILEVVVTLTLVVELTLVGTETLSLRNSLQFAGRVSPKCV